MSELVPFGPDIWIADGPIVPFFGFPYPTRMAAIRLANGDLFVWSPIALTPTSKSEIDRLGRVAHLVSPNKLHYLYLGEWRSAYPGARLYAPPGLARKRTELHFDAALSDTPDTAWASEIDQVRMDGSFALTEIVFFHCKSRTAIFADLIQNFPRDWYKGWQGVLARLGGITAPNPGAPRDFRFSFRDRKAARKALARILAWRPEQVLIAHGDVVRRDGTEFIRKAFRWLSP